MPRKEDRGLSGAPNRNVDHPSSEIDAEAKPDALVVWHFRFAVDHYALQSGGDDDNHPSDQAFTEAEQQIIQRIRAPQPGSVEWFEAQKKEG